MLFPTARFHIKKIICLSSDSNCSVRVSGLILPLHAMMLRPKLLISTKENSKKSTWMTESFWCIKFQRSNVKTQPIYASLLLETMEKMSFWSQKNFNFMTTRSRLFIFQQKMEICSSMHELKIPSRGHESKTWKNVGLCCGMHGRQG